MYVNHMAIGSDDRVALGIGVAVIVTMAVYWHLAAGRAPEDSSTMTFVLPFVTTLGFGHAPGRSRGFVAAAKQRTGSWR